MKKLIFALFSVSSLLFACKKSDPDPVAPTNQPYANANDGTNWIYEVKTQDATTLDTIVSLDTSRVSKPDTAIGSKSYYRVIHNDGTHTYFNVSGNDYYQFQHIVLPSVIDTSIEILYLKDNAATGVSWSQDLTVNVDIGGGITVPVKITFTSTITAAGTSNPKTINGITYPDVISVSTALTNNAGLPMTSNIVNHYARNIGLIQGNYDVDITSFGGIHNQTSLKYSDPH